MDYITNLRKYIGHSPLLMVGAAILILDEQDRLLLLKRSDSGCWGPPGGAMELGEEVETAAKRETLEETGLQVGDMDLFGVFSGPGLYYKYPNGDEVYNVAIIFKARQFHGEIRLNGEHTESRWFTLNSIPKDISPPIQPVIDRFIEEHG
jgi:ADP-ribose pyrophosphatase YjhB (NUDIX family)